MKVAAIIGALGLLMLEITLSASCRYICGAWNQYQARNGDAAAQAQVAGYSYTGECGFHDAAAGREFAAASAKQDNRDGLFWLSKYQFAGKGGDEDVAGAVATNEELIRLGDIRGAVNLGDYYRHLRPGPGQPKKRAYYYFKLTEYLDHESPQNTKYIRADSLKKAAALKNALSQDEVDDVERMIQKWRQTQ